MKKILGIVGSYRKGGTIDIMVSEVLASARDNGAQVSKIYLADRHIEFCTNCRACTQSPGDAPGQCIHRDDMMGIVAQCLESDAIVLGAPVNYFNVNAITRRFMERLVCFAYWPWGGKGPQMRMKARGIKAVLITTTAMPAFLARFFCGAMRALKLAAGSLGAKPIACIQVGMIAVNQKAAIPGKTLLKAREAGCKAAGK